MASIATGVSVSLIAMVNLRPSAPLSRLLLGYASSDARTRQALWWHWDERLAAILQGGREPAIMAIRLAWWRDVLIQGDEGKGRGEPLVEALRTSGLTEFDRQHIGRCVEGWGEIAGAEALSAADLLSYAQGRGGGLFSLLAGQSSPAIVAAGSIWALWDLAAHLSDPELAAACLAVAQDLLPEAQLGKAAVERPLRLALAVAAYDVRRQHIPSWGFGPRHYLRLLLASLTR